jgi:hypothetical protein
MLLIHLSLAQQVLVIEMRSVNLLCSIRPNYYLPYNPYEIRWLERPILVGINNDIRIAMAVAAAAAASEVCSRKTGFVDKGMP